MSRTPIAFASADVSALARSLREQLIALGEMPSHVTLLNMLARAGGYRNFQHLKATAEATPPVATPAPAAEPLAKLDAQRVERVVGHFGASGHLLRWPARTSQQELCVWVLWSRLSPREVTDERGISAWLNTQHDFGDAALLRRTLVTMGLVTRTQDGREYRRVERKPPPELLVVLGRIAAQAEAA